MDAHSEFPTFYVDDSVAEIGGKKHTILAAISFGDEGDAIAAWLAQKATCGVPPYEEVKWNNKALTLEQRRDFVPILNKGTGIVVIHEGDRQAAALKLIEQIWSYAQEENKQGFRIRLDEGIARHWNELQNAANSYFPPCVGLSQHNSASEQLLQVADFLAGAIKLQIDFGLGFQNWSKTIELPEVGQTEIGFFFFAALRYCLWGKITDIGDGVDTFHPIKDTINRGIVVISSQPKEILEKATAQLEGLYMGCIH